MDNGYILLHRKLLESACSSDMATFSIWIFLLLKCNHSPRKILLEGNDFIVQRGSWLGSLRIISEHFGISLSKVKRVVDYLERCQQVKTKRTSKYTYFTIPNYSKYQASETQKERQENAERKQIETNNNDNNDNIPLSEAIPFEWNNFAISLNVEPEQITNSYEAFKNHHLAMRTKPAGGFFGLWKNWIKRDVNKGKTYETTSRTNARNTRGNKANKLEVLNQGYEQVLADIAAGNI